MGAYATPTDVYRLALSAQAFVTRPRPLDPNAGDSLDPITGTFSLLAHGLTSTDRLRLLVTGRGAVPVGSTAGVPYYVLPLDFWRFQIAASQGGTALTFADAGSGAWGIQVDPEPRLLAHLIDAAARIDECLTAQAPPILRDPITNLYPAVIVGMNARMAARAAVTSLQIDNAAYRVAVDRLFALEEADNMTLAAWKDGRPILPAVTDQTATPDDTAHAGITTAPWITEAM